MKRINYFPYNRAVVGKGQISRAKAIEFARRQGVNLGGISRVRYAFLISREAIEMPRMAYTFAEWSRRVRVVSVSNMPHYFNGRYHSA